MYNKIEYIFYLQLIFKFELKFTYYKLYQILAASTNVENISRMYF